MSDRNRNDTNPSTDGAFQGALDQETFRALLFNSFLHQQTQSRARRSEGDRMASMAAIRRELAQVTELKAGLNLLTRGAVDLTGATGAALALSQGGQMTCYAVSGPTAPPLGAPVPLDSGLSGECLRSSCPQRCDDAATDARVNREACDSLGGVRSILLVPLRYCRATTGILEAFSTRPSAFEDIDEHVLELLAVMAAAVLADFADHATHARPARSPALGVRPPAPQPPA
jgi:GAF domain-containing protein